MTALAWSIIPVEACGLAAGVGKAPEVLKSAVVISVIERYSWMKVRGVGTSPRFLRITYILNFLVTSYHLCIQV